jgi:hypothetical protein
MRKVYDDLSLSRRMAGVIGQRAHTDKIIIVVLMIVTIAVGVFSMYFLKGLLARIFSD